MRQLPDATVKQVLKSGGALLTVDRKDGSKHQRRRDGIDSKVGDPQTPGQPLWIERQACSDPAVV